MESLENRLLLSITPSLVGNHATFVGTDGADDLYLRVTAAFLEFSEDGNSYHQDLDPDTPEDQTLAITDHSVITVELRGDDDRLVIQFSQSIDVQFDGGDGFDTLVLDTGSFDTVSFKALGDGSGEVRWNGDEKAISYSGLESLVDNTVASHRVIHLTDEDDPDARLSAALGEPLTLSGTTFGSITFPIPTQSLTIDGGAGTDAVTLDSIIDLGSADLVVMAEAILVTDSAQITTAGNVTLTATAENLVEDLSSLPLMEITASVLVEGQVNAVGSVRLEATVTNTVALDIFADSLMLESNSHAIAQIGSSAIVNAGNLTVSAVTNTDLAVEITDATSGGSGLGGTIVDGGRGNRTLLSDAGPAEFYLWNALSLNLDAPTYVVTHGWRDGLRKLESWSPLLSALEQFDPGANIVFTNWAEKSRNPYYPTAADDTYLVGGLLAAFLKDFDIDPTTTTLIGHSLGGQVSGVAGGQYKSLTGNSIARIIALDPAGPCFEEGTPIFGGKPEDKRLDANDADRVVALHTTSILGYDAPLADLDLYVNWGSARPTR
jgi:pimeloyl-ACP methyl ester carboxylesterase